MLKAIEQLQNGQMPPNAFRSSLISSHINDMELSTSTIFTPGNLFGITSLDLDKVENRYLLCGTKSGNLAIHDLLNTTAYPLYSVDDVGNVIRDPLSHRCRISTAQWYPFDTGVFTTSSMDKKLKVWDATNLKPAEAITMGYSIHGHHMSSMRTQNLLIAVAMAYPHVVLVDPKTGSRCHELRAHRSVVSSVRWSPSSEYLLASGGVDNRIFFWDIRSAKSYLGALDQHNSEATGSQKDLTTAHNGRVDNLMFTDDGLYLVSKGSDDRIKLWDVAFCKNTLVNFGVLPNRRSYRASMDMCCESKMPVLFVPCRNFVILYDLFTGTKIKKLVGHLSEVTTCVYSSATNELYSGASDMHILTWSPYVKNVREADSSLLQSEYEKYAERRANDDWSSDDSF